MLLCFFHSDFWSLEGGGVTGAKAIGTAWTIAPSEEEESIWGGKTLTKGNCTLFDKLTIVKLSMTKRVFIMHVFM